MISMNTKSKDVQRLENYLSAKGIEGIEIIDKGNGHIQVKGKLLVNWYPTSKEKSAYIAGTRKKFIGVSYKSVINMALTAPPICRNEKKRKPNRKRRKRLIEKDPYCYWCKQKGAKTFLTLENSTADHVIPLHRGGLDNMNNLVLSCEDCNLERGHDMPEMKGKK